MKFIIYTPGPVLTRSGTLPEVQAYVEGRVPLKRGWAGSWAATADGAQYTVRNGTGRVVNGVRVVRAEA